MRLTFGGVRGTRPVTGRAVERFGGDTTALLVEGRAGERILIDAGTGLQHLAAKVAGAPKPVLMLLTHYHLDHVLGLATSPLLYRRNLRLTLASPRRGGLTPRAALEHLLGPPLWPVAARHMPAQLTYRALAATPPSGGLRYGGLTVRWCAVQHPDGCHAYRIDEPATGAALVFATDIEWGVATAAARSDFLALCRQPQPAAVLVMDGQYDRRTAAATRGWGHSTWQDAVDVAAEAGIRRLLVTHHPPGARDAELARREQRLKQRAPGARLARQGMRVGIQ
jgi:ribonuclease BN (tRNA processing enzyme)